MKIKRRIYGLIIAMLVVNLSLFSQGKRRNSPHPNKPPPPHPELPIDGGITYLLFAGIAYGVYQIIRKKPNEYH